MSAKRPDSLELLRRMGYTIARSSSRMVTPVRVLDDVVVLDATRPADERWAATRWALDVVLDRLLADEENGGPRSVRADQQVVEEIAEQMASEAVELLTRELESAGVVVVEDHVLRFKDGQACPWLLRQYLDDGRWILTLGVAVRESPRRARDALEQALKWYVHRDDAWLRCEWYAERDPDARCINGGPVPV